MASRSKMSVRYLSTSALVEAYPFLVAASIAKWVEAGLVKTSSSGQRCEQDVINKYVSGLSEELERAKNKHDLGTIREEIDRARLRKIELEADIIEIERDSKRGELIDVVSAIAEVDGAFARVKTRLMGLPDRLALELSALSDPAEVRNLLDAVVREALQELHTELTTEPDDSQEFD